MLNQCRMTGFADEIDRQFDVQLQVLEELGQKYLELRAADGIGVADIGMEKAAELKRKIKDKGIGVSAIGSPIGKIGITDEFAPHFESYKHIVELAQYFDTPYIRMFSFYLPEETETQKYREQVFERMGRMIDYAKAENVTLLHENEKGIFGAMAPECRQLFDEFYGEHFRGIFDFANFVQCRQDTLEAYQLLEPFVSYIHVKDAVWGNGEVVLPGQGDGNLAEIFSKLDAKGYTGFLSMEPHLFNFAGLDLLEKEPGVKKESNGITAYKAAYKSLRELLNAG